MQRVHSDLIDRFISEAAIQISAAEKFLSNVGFTLDSGYQADTMSSGRWRPNADIDERKIGQMQSAIEMDQSTEVTKRVKARIISYSEIVERFREILAELEQQPLNEESILDKGAQLAFALDLCVGQMKSAQSTFYAEKRAHLAILEEAQGDITYKINTCTVEEISRQVTVAYKAFGIQ
ncbi:MAG: hypothetical protein IIA09_02265 [Proteobacteria bacterium]|nr:hypothetical protein [Pseudomonadota bacterium]